MIKKVKNRLKELRKEKGYTLDDVERLSGIKRGTYSNYENGNTEPKLFIWQYLASFYNVTVPYITGETPNKSEILRKINYLYCGYHDNKKEFQEIVDRYLKIIKAPLPLKIFTSDELLQYTDDVKKYWARYFSFVLNDFKAQLILSIGDDEEICNILKNEIRQKYLSLFQTPISKRFDKDCKLIVDDFYLSKDDLIRFCSKNEIISEINKLQNGLNIFKNDISELPENKSLD